MTANKFTVEQLLNITNVALSFKRGRVPMLQNTHTQTQTQMAQECVAVKIMQINERTPSLGGLGSHF